MQSVETQAASLTRYKGFGEYVKKKLGVELELFLASEYAGVIQAIGAKQIEVMDMGASGYAAAWVESKGGVEPLVVPTNNDGTVGYYSVAFVRSDSPYKTLADLKGKIWAWAEPNSSSGYLFPLVGLRKMGLEPDKHFGKVVFSGRARAEHHRRARQVLRRRGHLDRRRQEAQPRRPAHDARAQGPQEGGHPHHLGLRPDPQPGHRHPLRPARRT